MSTANFVDSGWSSSIFQLLLILWASRALCAVHSAQGPVEAGLSCGGSVHPSVCVCPPGLPPSSFLPSPLAQNSLLWHPPPFLLANATHFSSYWKNLSTHNPTWRTFIFQGQTATPQTAGFPQTLNYLAWHSRTPINYLAANQALGLVFHFCLCTLCSAVLSFRPFALSRERRH